MRRKTSVDIDELVDTKCPFTPTAQRYLQGFIVVKLLLFIVFGPLAAAFVYEFTQVVASELGNDPLVYPLHTPVIWYSVGYLLRYLFGLLCLLLVSCIIPFLAPLLRLGVTLLCVTLGLLADVVWVLPRVLMGANVDYFLYFDSPADRPENSPRIPTNGPPLLFSRTTNLLMTLIVAAGTFATTYISLPKYLELTRQGDEVLAKEEYRQQGVAIEAPLIQQALDEVHEAKTVQEARSALYSAKTCVGLSVSYKNNELKKQALDMLQAAIDNLPEDSEATKMQLHEWKPRMERTLRLVPVPF